MTRRGLFAFPLLLFGKAPKAEERVAWSHKMHCGWTCTVDEPAWLAAERIDEKTAAGWQPQREYTIITRIHR